MNRRRIWQIIGWVAPVVAVIVALGVLRGAGVPLTLPGILIVLAVLFAARFFFGRRRGRRAAQRDGRAGG